MNNHDKNQRKEIYYLKIKNDLQDNKPWIKKALEYSCLSDFNKFDAIIKNVIKNAQKSIDFQECIIVLILNHPVLKDIYIYTKEQWQLYYNYNIIEQCITNKILKVKYSLLVEKDSLKYIKKNKKNVIKYIIQNIPLSLFSKIFFTFLKDNDEIAKKFEVFFIQELINETPEKHNNKKKQKEIDIDDVDSNLNINSILNSKVYEERNFVTEENNSKLFPKIDKEYLLHTNDFLKTLENQFKILSEKQNNLNNIKEILGEDSESSKIESEKDFELKTNLNLNFEVPKNSLSLFEDNIYENNDLEKNVLLTQMTPPPSYFKTLLNDDNFFKQPNKKEYYTGIEEFKDEMNRQLLKYTKEFE